MPTRTRSVTIAAVVAVIFGLLTIFSGGRALFGGADMGAVVPFVLWFNFLAGFAYVSRRLGSLVSHHLGDWPLYFHRTGNRNRVRHLPLAGLERDSIRSANDGCHGASPCHLGGNLDRRGQKR